MIFYVFLSLLISALYFRGFPVVFLAFFLCLCVFLAPEFRVWILTTEEGKEDDSSLGGRDMLKDTKEF